MGLLTVGTPLTWEETKKLSKYVKKHGVIQFINLWKKAKDRRGDTLKWGDEIEYFLVKFDDEKKVAKLSLRSYELLLKLNEKEEADPHGVKSLWRPECCAYQIESTPGQPYGGLLAYMKTVEENMQYRRQEAMEHLQPNEAIMSCVMFPRMGCPDSIDPPAQITPNSGYSRSLFLPDEVIFPGHPRYKTLVTNIRQRRGERPTINIPIYKDKNLQLPFREDLAALGDDGSSQRAALDNHIYLDAMGFGMGCNCLQVTIQAYDINEARVLYDQLTPLGPIMLAVTAASPLYRGYVSDSDSRWIACSNSVDCRTRGERGLDLLRDNESLVAQSRNGATESYLSEQGDKYNDLPLLYDEESYNLLLKNGVDKLLAQHIAHLFIRDCVCLMAEQLEQDDENESDHFETIQSTNWQSLRFKPPPPNSQIGWRVEFRLCDAQITDFENAAVVCFIVLLSRIIITYNLNFLIPISKVTDNIMRAQKRDAVNCEKFWFRKDIMTHNENQPIDEEYCELSVNEVINGSEGVFIGLIPLINSYIDSMNVDVDTRCTLQRYLGLISGRASGELMTVAAWMRKQVLTHSEYKHDSIVTERINYDLLKKALDIQRGYETCPEMLGSFATSSKTSEIESTCKNSEE